MMKTILDRALMALAFGGVMTVGATALAQDLTDIGAGQIPYVLFLLDTSGSTEWTDAGDERYPRIDPADYGGVVPYGLNGEPVEWEADMDMDVWDESEDSNYSTDVDDGARLFGPCFVWEPEDCSDYHRPGFFVAAGVAGEADSWLPSSTTAKMEERFDWMRGTDSNLGIRLRESSQPRHVTLKEVLAGQMLLKPAGSTKTAATLNPATEGPGCWFVRRQIGASVLDADEQDYCAGDRGNFENLPDFEEPRPHFQEVITDRRPNSGILANFAQQAVFGVAFMDGYKDNVSWEKDLNDDISNSSIPTNTRRTVADNEGNSNRDNLGVYRIVTPKEIEIPPGILQQLSGFIQTTVNEAGAIGKDDFYDKDLEADKNKFAWLGLNFDKDAGKYMDKYKLGKQPIARATPIAAAIADIHQFMITERRFEDEEDTGDKKADKFARCRQKHIIVVTDGYPEPEAPGGVNNIGVSGLTSAFGYDDPNTTYRYMNSEAEIQQLVDDEDIPPATADGDRVKFGPRVHIVSLDVQNDPTLRSQVATKLSEMALAGNTCASAAMLDKRQTAPANCDPTLEWCLVDQPSGSWGPPDGTGPATCDDPALMITRNDPSSIEEALGALMGTVVGSSGTLSRTRAAVTNNLDDATKGQGGQYRVYSATETGGGVYWRGILNRQYLPCTATGNLTAYGGSGVDSSTITTALFHNEIADQVGVVAEDSPNPTDSRRIFTSVPMETLYDYNANRAIDLTTTPLSGVEDIFHWKFDLARAGGSADDEFGGTTLPAPIEDPTLLLGTRVPFLESYLQDAFTAATSTTVTTWSAADLYDYFGTDPLVSAQFEDVVNIWRGRVKNKATGADSTERVLGSILNSDPVAVGPPDLDLPIESYRAFRARYGDRPTMLYFSTTEGLLHGVHTGKLEGRVNIRGLSNTKGADAKDDAKGAEAQREAWAYMPAIMHRKLASTIYSQPYIMDGEPVVKDVRLCAKDAAENQNDRVCKVLKDGNVTTESLTGEQQWRTVLVQGLGSAGAGYFAMDVTRSGGIDIGATARSIGNPDPIPVWEFDRVWEEQQIEYMVADTTLAARVLPTSSVSDLTTADDGQQWVDTNNDGTLNGYCNPDDPVWENALLGKSISRPEIATLQVEWQHNSSTIVRQRPVAVFGGGSTFDLGQRCGAGVVGSAIYVVDLQTGTILRRFVDYDDGTGTRHTFHRAQVDSNTVPVSLTGSPALFDSFTGSVATRGFIGGSAGRLYKMDFSDPNPSNWDVSLFFDPYEEPDIKLKAVDESSNPIPFGPAGFKPAIARSPGKTLVVAYGLGEPGEVTSAGRAQAIITIEELENGNSSLRWYQVFQDSSGNAEGQKMTGDPLIFNGVTYFPTYEVPDADICEPGTAKIWALDYYEHNMNEPIGEWNPSDPQFSDAATVVDTPDGKWFGPTDPTLIRGLTLTTGPACSVRDFGTDSQNSDGLEGADPQPQLIAQSSGVPGGNVSDANTSATDAVSRLVVDLERPRSMTVPLSWSVIGN